MRSTSPKASRGALRPRVLDRHARRPRDRADGAPNSRSLLHAAAQGPRLQQQRGAHLRALPDRRPRVQARFKTVGDRLARRLRFVFATPALGAGAAARPRGRQHPAERRRDHRRDDPDALHARRRDRARAAFRRRRRRKASTASTSTGTAAAARAASPARRSRCTRASRSSRRWSTSSTHAGGRGAAIDEVRARAPAPGSTPRSCAPSSTSRATEVLGHARTRRCRERRLRDRAAAQARSSSTTIISTTSPPRSARSIDTKSPFTRGHSDRVATIADAHRRRLGVADAGAGGCAARALLHDVGKLGVSNAILDKPGPLDETEWAAMRAPRRPHAGDPRPHRRVRRTRARSPPRTTSGSTAAAIRSGLARGAIRRETRIITDCDVYDALLGRPPVPRGHATARGAGDDGASRSGARSIPTASKR